MYDIIKMTENGLPFVGSQDNFDLSILEDQKNLLVLRENEDANFLVIQRKIKNTKLSLVEDEDEAEEVIYNNSLKGVLDNDSYSYPSVVVNSEDLDDFLDNSSEVISELFNMLLDHSGITDPKKLLKKLLPLKRKYAPIFIVTKISTMTKDDLNIFLKSSDSLRAFENYLVN